MTNIDVMSSVVETSQPYFNVMSTVVETSRPYKNVYHKRSLHFANASVEMTQWFNIVMSTGKHVVFGTETSRPLELSCRLHEVRSVSVVETAQPFG